MSPRAPWALLGCLLLALVGSAASFDRGTWPHFLGDEATYLMQAESLAWDFDLRYERRDYNRFVEHWGLSPEGLILQSGDEGRTISYGKPSIYPAAIAPFVRLAPRRGAAVGNAFYLALAALLAAFALRGTLGAQAPLWVAAFVFASVTFGHVYWAHADLFLLSLVALSLAAVYGSGEKEERAPGGRLRFVVAGALLAAVGLSRPLYASLLLPVAWAAKPRRASRWALAGGVAAVLVLSVLGNLAVRHSWTPYGGQRMGFYAATGFPAVDFPADDWAAALAERPGSGSWVERGKFVYPVNPRLLGYDVVYFLVGRDIGLIPYFLPCLLGLAAFRPGRGRWLLLLAVALTAGGFFYLRAFNFYGGGGSLANRYFLPMYPAFWFLVARRRSWLLPVGVSLVAAPFLWPLWSAPRAFPLHPDGGFRYVSTSARAVLPYETSMSHLKPAGREDVQHGGLWIRRLSRGVRHPPSGTHFRTEQAEVELLVGRNHETAALVLSFERPPKHPPTIGGAVRGIEALDERSFRLELGRPTARHRMWWTFDDVILYRIELGALTPRAGGFQLAAVDG